MHILNGFKLGGLREKHTVATWNLGIISLKIGFLQNYIYIYIYIVNLCIVPLLVYVQPKARGSVVC
jgi:hypothetical protein